MEKAKAYWLDGHGERIRSADDGFLIKGNIYVACPYEGGNEDLYGLVGCDLEEDVLFSDVPFAAVSKEEFIRLLHYTPDELVEIAKSIRKEGNPQPDPIKLGKDGWYFSDETWTEDFGPYKTKREAQSKLKEYCDHLNRKGVEEDAAPDA